MRWDGRACEEAMFVSGSCRERCGCDTGTFEFMDITNVTFVELCSAHNCGGGIQFVRHFQGAQERLS